MQFAILLGKAAAAMLATLIVADFIVRLTLPHTSRLNENFSAAYLQRAVREDDLQAKVVVVGDSALWGYRVSPSESAVARFGQAAIPVENFAFEGGSPANAYALLRLLEAEHIRPRAVLFNVNLKEFNAADSAYNTLYPGLEQLVWNDLTIEERKLLKPTRHATFDASADATLSSWWALYGMRNDVREQLFGTPDAITAIRNQIEKMSGETVRAEAAHVPTSDKFLGTYDLSQLSDANVEVVFLKKFALLLQTEHIPAVAILTPTNHGLLHDYIDTPDYDAQLTYVSVLLRRHGIRVLNYDRAFKPDEFFDNDHLTVAGNEHLSALLQSDVRL
jgi:hypothetical protein